jgi:phosphoribosylanthranilate isomerase
MWIKICGNTRLEDCLAAAELGADAVGFVFAPGKRTVIASQVAAITPELPPTLEKIGVFTSRDAQQVVETAQQAGLTGVQLHGPVDLPLAQAIRSAFAGVTGFRLIQVMHWWTDIAPADQQAAFAA